MLAGPHQIPPPPAGKSATNSGMRCKVARPSRSVARASEGQPMVGFGFRVYYRGLNN